MTASVKKPPKPIRPNRNGAIKADVWKKKRGERWIMDLPSGQQVLVWKPHILDMIRVGIMPTDLANSLSHFQEAAIKDGDGTPKIDGQGGVQVDMQKITGADYKAMTEMAEKFALVAVKEPKIVEKQEDDKDAICISDIPFEDIFYIFTTIQSAPEVTPPDFFRKQVESDNSSSNGE